MNKPLIRPRENAYPRPPFFHLGPRTEWAIPYYFACTVLLTLGSATVYGYGVLIHALIMQAAGFALVPALSFFKKNLFYNSLLWQADLLVLNILLPVSLPWHLSLASAVLFILGARLFMIPENKPLFQPHALTLVLILHYWGIFSPTVFHIMPEMSLSAWHEASYALFLGQNTALIRDVPFIIGGAGGSIFLVLFTGAALSAVKAINFSLTVIYIAVFGLAVLFFGIPEGENYLRISEILFIGFFLLPAPAPLDYRKKLLHAFLAAVFGCLLLGLKLEFPLLMGVLAANLFTPFLDILPLKILKEEKKEKRLSIMPDALITGAFSLLLAAVSYFFGRLS